MSLVFPYHLPWDEASTVVRRAEGAGLHGVWAYENPGERGAFVVMGALLAVTARLRVGIGVVRTYVRHPQTTAMEAAQARALAGDRVVVGIGAGSPGGAAALGLGFGKPLAALRESVEAIRSYRLPGLDGPPQVHIGGMGPRVLDLAGALADGAVVTMHAPLPFVAECASRVQRAASREGNDCEVVAYAHVAVAATEEEALRRAKSELVPTLSRIGDAPAFQRLYEAAGLDVTACLEAVAQLRAGTDAQHAVPDALAAALCLTSTPATLATALESYARAGADEVALLAPALAPAGYDALFEALPPAP